MSSARCSSETREVYQRLLNHYCRPISQFDKLYVNICIFRLQIMIRVSYIMPALNLALNADFEKNKKQKKTLKKHN